MAIVSQEGFLTFVWFKEGATGLAKCMHSACV